jgi:hypothetical protein
MEDRTENLRIKVKELVEYNLTDKHIIEVLQVSNYSIEEISNMIIEVEALNKQKRKEYMKQYGKQYYIDNKIELRKKQKVWNESHKNIIKKSTRKHTVKKYGLTLEQYDELFNKQEGKCAICGKHQSELKQALCVDHDHITKKVRGLLCITCNRGIGYLNDNIQLLSQAINYLNNS